MSKIPIRCALFTNYFSYQKLFPSFPIYSPLASGETPSTTPRSSFEFKVTEKILRGKLGQVLWLNSLGEEKMAEIKKAGKPIGAAPKDFTESLIKRFKEKDFSNEESEDIAKTVAIIFANEDPESFSNIKMKIKIAEKEIHLKNKNSIPEVIMEYERMAEAIKRTPAAKNDLAKC